MADAQFVASHTNTNRAVVTRQGLPGKPDFRLEMTPAEAEKATYLVSIAASLGDIDPLPDHLANTPFVVRLFSKPRFAAALEREDRGGSIPFRRNEDSDALIDAIRTAVGMAVNAQQLGGVAGRSHGVGMRSGLSGGEHVEG